MNERHKCGPKDETANAGGTNEALGIDKRNLSVPDTELQNSEVCDLNGLTMIVLPLT